MQYLLFLQLYIEKNIHKTKNKSKHNNKEKRPAHRLLFTKYRDTGLFIFIQIILNDEITLVVL